jgi:hypothetical protein
MTNTMELKRSNLVLPTTGYELDREEMSYVEGGGTLHVVGTIILTVALLRSAFNGGVGVVTNLVFWAVNFTGVGAFIVNAVVRLISDYVSETYITSNATLNIDASVWSLWNQNTNFGTVTIGW